MKKITITFALLTLAVMAAFAAGTSEDNTMPWTQGQGQYQSNAVVSQETTTVTGTIQLVNGGHVELIAGNETYELVYPYRLSYAADLQDGMEITVEGFEAEGLRLDNDPATKNLVLKSATINGETYDLTDGSINFGGFGQRGNHQGGNIITNNTYRRNNLQTAPMGQMGRNSNRQGGSFRKGSYGRGRS